MDKISGFPHWKEGELKSRLRIDTTGMVMLSIRWNTSLVICSSLLH